MSLKDKNNNLAEEKILPLLFRLAVPSICAQIVNALYNIVDRVYIGHIKGIGAEALTGVGICFPIIMIFTAFAYLISMGGAPKAAIYMGKGNNKCAERILGNCLSAHIIVSVLLTIIYIIFGDKILILFGASSETLEYAAEYMGVYIMGTVFVQIALGLNCFITSQGFANISMKTVLIGAVFNIVLDPIFIYVLNMGVSGAALATIISQFISAAWVLKFLCGNKTILKIKKENLIIRPKILFSAVVLGISPFIMNFTEAVLNLCFNTSLRLYGGDLAVGAITIMSSVMQFTMLPLTGLMQGAQPIISYNYGAKNIERVKKTFISAFSAGVSYAFVFWLLIMTMPYVFVSMFTSDAQLREAAALLIRIYMAVSFLMGAQMVCQQTFVALGKAGISIFIALLRKVILLIPLIYILPLFFEKNIEKVIAVVLAEPVADTVSATTAVISFIIVFKGIIRKERKA